MDAAQTGCLAMPAMRCPVLQVYSADPSLLEPQATALSRGLVSNSDAKIAGAAAAAVAAAAAAAAAAAGPDRGAAGGV